MYQNLVSIGNQLERHFRDMQDMEFTIQEGHLYILQSRSGKRAPLAELRIAVDLCNEGVISKQDALAIVAGIDLEHLVIERINTNDIPVASGLSASGGVVCGKIAFTTEAAELLAKDGPVILIRDTPSPDDIPGIKAAAGLLTSRGARTSHAAVVARQPRKSLRRGLFRPGDRYGTPPVQDDRPGIPGGGYDHPGRDERCSICRVCRNHQETARGPDCSY